jgi:hypothetical protein
LSAALYFVTRKGKGQRFDKLSPNGVFMRILLASPALLVTACVNPQPRPTPVATVSPPMRPVGLERVLGANGRELVALFGMADQDVREATARRLQFAGPICILDAYLYPPASGGEPTVTYVDARQPDGRDIDRASCVAALVRRKEAR